MPTLIRILRMLSIVVWVGGMIFFAFVLAPVTFHVLPMQRMAGMVVSGSLRVLDGVGLVCGVVFWAATVLLFRERERARNYENQLLLASVMIAATGYLHTGILPAMEHDRIMAGNDIQLAPEISPAKIHFQKLHKRSETLEGAVLVCGLAIVVLMARESLPPKVTRT